MSTRVDLQAAQTPRACSIHVGGHHGVVLPASHLLSFAAGFTGAACQSHALVAFHKLTVCCHLHDDIVSFVAYNVTTLTGYQCQCCLCTG